MYTYQVAISFACIFKARIRRDGKVVETLSARSYVIQTKNGSRYVVVVVVVGYPTSSEGWGHGGRPWSPRSRATPQGLDQRS